MSNPGGATHVPRWLRIASDISWRAIVVGLGVIGLAIVATRLHLVVVPLIISLFVASLLSPPVIWLKERGVPGVLATLVVFVLAIGLFAGLVAAVAPSVVSEVGQMSKVVRAGTTDVLTWISEGPLGVSEAEVNKFVGTIGDRLQDNVSPIAEGVLKGALTALELFAGLLLTLILAFFFVKDGSRISRALIGFVRPEHRDHARAIGQRAWGTLGAYLRGIAFIALVDATLIGAALAIIGVPLVLPLAMFVFFGAFLPLVGALAAGTVAALVALVTGGVVNAALVVVTIVAIQQIEGHVLAPLVLSRVTRLHPVAVILALTAGTILGGILGAFISVPVAAVVAGVVDYARTDADSAGLESSTDGAA